MEEKHQAALAHKVLLQGRRQLELCGVKEIISFDAKEVVLNTQQGILFVRGDELFVKRLTVEAGEVDLEGRIDSMIYSEKGGREKEKTSFVKRLFQ